MKTTIACVTWMLFTACGTLAAENRYDAPNQGNPIIAGYFADPTVRKFGDTFYLYSTTDGTGHGVGDMQVWTSRDFVNWTSHLLDWPRTEEKWAPEVVQGDDGLFYMLTSVPCVLYGAVSPTPFGPWRNMRDDGRPLIPNHYVDPVITLDGQFFRDDDGKWYSMFCTWAIYPGHGVGMVRHGPDMFPIDAERFMIPNTQLIDVFEAPFMVKKDGLYYLMYSAGSCHDHTYQVRYGVSDNIRGPYTYPDNNPILETTADRTIHGPGHHSVLELNGRYYIVYHRHNNPFSSYGMFRQIAVDVMEFGPRGIIEKVTPTHTGVGYLGPDSMPFDDLAFGRPVEASSYYNDDFRPAYAVDNNNGTLWRAAVNTPGNHWLKIDLGQTHRIRRVHTQFEYAHWYYQYNLEVSQDGQSWTLFSDKRDNRLCGSPMVDYGHTEARYVRLTVTNWEYPGLGAGVWNIKVFGQAKEDPPQLLVHLEADDLAGTAAPHWSNNKGMLGGALRSGGRFEVTTIDGITVVRPQDNEPLVSSFVVPETLGSGYGFTLLKKVYRQGRWVNVVKTEQDADEVVIRGRPLRLAPGQAVASLRLFNRKLSADEIDYYQTLPYQRPTEPTPLALGLLVHLEPSELTLGSTAHTLPNRGALGGEFVALQNAPMITMQGGRQALAFNGQQMMQSSFRTPQTLTGNSSYSVAVWAFNPDIDSIECMVSWAPRGGFPGRSAQFNYGSHRDLGALRHQGWADMRYQPLPPAGQWHHLAVTFDGYMEKVFVNGVLNNQQQKMLFLNSDGRIYLGMADGRHDPFSGLLGSVRIFDRSLSAEEIQTLADEPAQTDLKVHLSTAQLDYGPLNRWHNSASAHGSVTFKPEAVTVADVAGLIAAVFHEPVADSMLAGPDVIPFRDITGPFSQVTVVSPDLETWYHIVWVVDANRRMTVYENGRTLQDVPYWINRLWEASFTGATALLQIYDRALSDDCVAQLYRVWNIDRQAPEFIEDGFEAGPLPLSTTAVMMIAQPAHDAGGVVAYHFEEISGNEGGRDSGWIHQRQYHNHGLRPDTEYVYRVKARDNYGNVSSPSTPVSVMTDSALFEEFADDFTEDRDYAKNGLAGSVWDGLIGQDSDRTNTVVASRNGVLRLESQSTWWDNSVVHAERPNLRGPLLYKLVEGDFLVEAKIADYEGLSRRQGRNNNDGGLMVRVHNPNNNDERLIQLAFFPIYNVGNLGTNLTGSLRPQVGNQLGWDAARWLQIQRAGDVFHLRISHDGLNWSEMPGSPLRRPDIAGRPLQVGLYQCMYSDARSWVEFEDFRLSVRKTPLK